MAGVQSYLSEWLKPGVEKPCTSPTLGLILIEGHQGQLLRPIRQTIEHPTRALAQ